MASNDDGRLRKKSERNTATYSLPNRRWRRLLSVLPGSLGSHDVSGTRELGVLANKRESGFEVSVAII